jgi:SNF2 family DNA or RNA helicase
MDWQCKCTFFNSSLEQNCLLCSCPKPKRQLDQAGDKGSKKLKGSPEYNPFAVNIIDSDTATTSSDAGLLPRKYDEPWKSDIHADTNYQSLQPVKQMEDSFDKEVHGMDKINQQIQDQKDKNFLNQVDLLDDIIFSSPVGGRKNIELDADTLVQFNTPGPSKLKDVVRSSDLPLDTIAADKLSPSALQTPVANIPPSSEVKLEENKQVTLRSLTSNSLHTSHEQLQAMDEIRAEKIVNSITTDDELDNILNQIISDLKKANSGNGTPKALSITLMPHQLKGLAWMIKMEADPEYRGGILADGNF